MKKVFSKINIQSVFYIFISIYFFTSAITLTMVPRVSFLEKFFQIIRYICYLMFIMIIIYNIIKDTSFKRHIYIINYLKQHILLLFMLVISFITMIKSKNKVILILVIVMWVCNFYDIKKIFKCFLVSGTLVFFIACICSLFNLIPEVIINRGETIRYSLGYIYPLELMTHFLFLLMLYIYLNSNEYRAIDCIYINIINILIYKITDARSSFILIFIFSILSYFIARKKIRLKKIKEIYFYIFLLLCSIVPIISSLLYDPNNVIMYKINRILSNRLLLTNEAFNKYDLSLFGKNIEWIGFGGKLNPSSISDIYNFVDCAYAKCLFDYGIITTIFIILGYAAIYRYSFKENNCILILIISITLIVSIVEPRLFSIELNPYILLMNKGLLLTNSDIMKFFKRKSLYID